MEPMLIIKSKQPRVLPTAPTPTEIRPFESKDDSEFFIPDGFGIKRASTLIVRKAASHLVQVFRRKQDEEKKQLDRFLKSYSRHHYKAVEHDDFWDEARMELVEAPRWRYAGAAPRLKRSKSFTSAFLLHHHELKRRGEKSFVERLRTRMKINNMKSKHSTTKRWTKSKSVHRVTPINIPCELADVESRSTSPRINCTMQNTTNSEVISPRLNSSFYNPKNNMNWYGRLKFDYKKALKENNGYHVIAPGWTVTNVWTILVLLIIFWNMVATPFTMAFGVSYTTVSVIILQILGDMILAVDIAVNFRRGFWKEGSIVMDPEVIKWAYLKSWFILDVISALPIDHLYQMAGVPSDEVPSAARIPKLLRCLRFFRLWSDLEKEMGSYLQVFRIFLISFLITHWEACMYYTISTGEGYGTSTWVLPTTMRDKSTIHVYLYCFYWSVGIFSSTVSPEVPVTEAQGWYTLICMFLGVLCFAYVVGAMASIIEAANENQSDFQNMLNTINRFVHSHSLTHETAERLTTYLTYKWELQKGYNMERVVDDLPSLLKTDVISFMAEGVIGKVPLFNGLQRGFLSSLSNRIQRMLYVPMEYVVYAGDIGREMFFIHDGTVEILLPGSVNAVAELKAGQWFGESILLVDDDTVTRSASVRAKTFCNLFYIDDKNIKEMCAAYPQAADLLIFRVRQHMNELSKKDRNARDARKESLISDMANIKSLQEKHSKTQGLNKRCCSFVISPNSNFKTYWTFLLLILSLQNFITILFRSVFEYDTVAWYLVDALLDACFLADIVISFHTGFVERGTIVMDLYRIQRKYMYSRYFVLDIVSLVPFELFALIPGLAPCYPVCRFNRILRFPVHISMTERFIARSPHERFLRLLRHILALVLLAHLVACIYFSFVFFEGYADPNECTYDCWLPEAVLADKPIRRKYMRSFYTAFSMLTGVGKSMYPRNTTQLMFNIAVMVTGLYVVAYLISQVADVISNLDAFANAQKARMTYANGFLEVHGFPEDIKSRIRKYLEFTYVSSEGVDPNKVLDTLPYAMRAEVNRSICGEMLKRVPLLALKCRDDLVLDRLAARLRFESYPEGEFIYRKMDIGFCMYFIQSGSVELLDSEFWAGNKVEEVEQDPILIVKEGNVFGDSLMFEGLAWLSARAKTNVALLSLHHEDFDVVFRDETTLMSAVKDIAISRKRRKDHGIRRRGHSAPRYHKKSGFSMFA